MFYGNKWHTKQGEMESESLSNTRTMTRKRSVFTWTESEIAWGLDTSVSWPDEAEKILRYRLSRVTGRLTGSHTVGSFHNSISGECKKLEGKKF